MKRSVRAGWLRGVFCAVALAASSAVACSSDETGTDIEVGGQTGGAGSAGKGNQQGGGTSSTSAGTHMGDGGSSDAAAGEAGGPGAASGTGGSSAGTGGAGGTPGNSGGVSGSGGLAGSAGQSGSGGAGGGAGGVGVAGTAGTNGSAGSGGAAGTVGTGGHAGMAGSGGTAGGTNLDCGNGTVEGSEECDDNGPSRLCSDDCETVSTAACVECEQAGDCFASSDNCKGPAATPFTPEQVAICYDVMRCVQDSNCLDAPGGSLGKCYCGTLSTAACGAAPFDLKAAGAPNGPCAAIMQLGSPGVVNNSAILGGLTTKSRAGGAAGQRLNCQRNSAEPACAAICGLE